MELNKELIFSRMKAVALGEDKSNTCVCCKQLVNVEKENITIEATYENGDKKFIYPVCDDCKFIVMGYLFKVE